MDEYIGWIILFFYVAIWLVIIRPTTKTIQRAWIGMNADNTASDAFKPKIEPIWVGKRLEYKEVAPAKRQPEEMFTYQIAWSMIFGTVLGGLWPMLIPYWVSHLLWDRNKPGIEVERNRLKQEAERQRELDRRMAEHRELTEKIMAEEGW